MIRGDVIGQIDALKQSAGGPLLVVRSRTLAQPLLVAGLVEELHLQVFPILLGSGARLYPDSTDKASLQLVESSALPNGVLVQRYRVART